MLTLPSIVNWAIVAGVGIGGLALVWAIIRWFIVRHDLRYVRREYERAIRIAHQRRTTFAKTDDGKQPTEPE